MREARALYRIAASRPGPTIDAGGSYARQKDAVKSSQDSLHLANQLYSRGLVSFINVLDAERSVYLAEDALADSDRFVTENLISLYKSLGGGWETLEQPSQLAQAKTTAQATADSAR